MTFNRYSTAQGLRQKFLFSLNSHKFGQLEGA